MRGHFDSVFMAEYRDHAANCFRVVGTAGTIDGCLLTGPPLAGCDVGEALHRLATRKQEPAPPCVLIQHMRYWR